MHEQKHCVGEWVPCVCKCMYEPCSTGVTASGVSGSRGSCLGLHQQVDTRVQRLDDLGLLDEEARARRDIDGTVGADRRVLAAFAFVFFSTGGFIIGNDYVRMYIVVCVRF